MALSKVLTTLFLQVQCFRKLSLQELLSLLHLWFSLESQTPNTLSFSTSGSLARILLLLSLALQVPLCQCSAPTRPRLQTYPPFAHFVIPLFLAVLLHLILLPLQNRSEFCNGMPEVFDPEASNFSTLSRFILQTLFVSWNPISTHLPLSEFLMLCYLIAFTSGLAFFLPMICTFAVVSSFWLGRAYDFLNSQPLSILNM